MGICKLGGVFMSDKYNKILEECNKCIDTNDLELAFNYAHLLLDTYEDENLEIDLTNIFYNIEKILINTPNSILYVTYMQRLIDIFKYEGKYEEMISAMYSLAIDYIAIEKFDVSEILLNDAMKIAKKRGLLSTQADLLNGYGNICEMKNENEKALEYYLMAFSLAKECKYEEGERFHHNIGFANKKLKQYKKAISHIKQALEYATKTNRVDRQANSWNELGDTYSKAGDFFLAHKALDTAHKCCLETNSKAFLMENYSYRCDLYENEENFKAALEYSRKYHDLSKTISVDVLNSEINSHQFKSEINSKKMENEIIIKKNMELEAFARALDKSNKSLLESINENKKNQKKAIQSEKNASYNRMMIGVAHKVNTSVSNINLLASHMKIDITNFKIKYFESKLTKRDLLDCINQTQDNIEFIEISSTKISKFIESIKNVSISINEMNTKGTYEQLVDDCLLENEKRINERACNLVINIQEDIHDLIGYNIFKRIFNQLFDNALRYAFIDNLNNEISITIRISDSGKIVILFKDNGIGISSNDLGQIFDPFYTSNMGLEGGAGMGLYVLQKTINEVLSGEVTCTSELEKGTQFEIELDNQLHLLI